MVELHGQFVLFSKLSFFSVLSHWGLKNKAVEGRAYLQKLWDVVQSEHKSGRPVLRKTEWCNQHRSFCMLDPPSHPGALRGHDGLLRTQASQAYDGLQPNWIDLLKNGKLSLLTFLFFRTLDHFNPTAASSTYAGSIAGTTCIDFSSMGKAMHFLGPSTLPFIEWIFEIVLGS